MVTKGNKSVLKYFNKGLLIRKAKIKNFYFCKNMVRVVSEKSSRNKNFQLYNLIIYYIINCIKLFFYQLL
jgi:hypothetical protein